MPLICSVQARGQLLFVPGILFPVSVRSKKRRSGIKNLSAILHRATANHMFGQARTNWKHFIDTDRLRFPLLNIRIICNTAYFENIAHIVKLYIESDFILFSIQFIPYELNGLRMGLLNYEQEESSVNQHSVTMYCKAYKWQQNSDIQTGMS
jgi:hypothetical protein